MRHQRALQSGSTALLPLTSSVPPFCLGMLHLHLPRYGYDHNARLELCLSVSGDIGWTFGDCEADIFPGSFAHLGAVRGTRRGKRDGASCRTHQRRREPPLPSVLLSGAQPLRRGLDDCTRTYCEPGMRSCCVVAPGKMAPLYVACRPPPSAGIVFFLFVLFFFYAIDSLLLHERHQLLSLHLSDATVAFLIITIRTLDPHLCSMTSLFTSTMVRCPLQDVAPSAVETGPGVL